MKIEELNGWNKFYIPIPANNEEEDTAYLTRVRECLKTFYEKYSSLSPKSREAIRLFEDRNLESLTEEGNFCEMYLAGIPYCDVKFAVGTPHDNYGRIGIDVWSHSDEPRRRKPMVDFLKEKWRKFEYSF